MDRCLMPPSRPTTYRAQYIFPVSGPPIENGTVSIDQGRIVACGRDVGDGNDVQDLGNVAILPGLVNAHAHLDFSDLTKPIGTPGMGFVDWIRLVLQERRCRTTSADEALALGLEESRRHGVATLADIAQADWPYAIANDSSLRIVAFRELIAPTAERVSDALRVAREHVEKSRKSRWIAGLSPHAPYSVHPNLLSGIVALSAETKTPIAMHLAESQEEMAFLHDGTGPLRELLEERGGLDPSTIRPGRRPLDFLQVLALAHQALIVHGTYLDDEEIAFLGRHAERMAVVYCPQTHAWFERGHYPLEKMLAAGVVVALGTDGRGSSPDLSIFSAMRLIARNHPSIPLSRILELGTLGGAKALGLDLEIGTLTPGRKAEFTVVELPNRAAADPHTLLFDVE